MRAGLRDRRWSNMVEEPIIFIVGREEDCFTPDLRVIGQGIEYLQTYQAP